METEFLTLFIFFRVKYMVQPYLLIKIQAQLSFNLTYLIFSGDPESQKIVMSNPSDILILLNSVV